MTEIQNTSNIPELNSPFEQLREVDANGKEWWNSRKLARVMGYGKYWNFERVIAKAQAWTSQKGYHLSEHFVEITEMAELGSGAVREVTSIRLSRAACMAVAMNADKKKEIHDYDLLYLVGDIDRMKQQSVSLKFLQVTTGTLVPTATVVLKFGDHERMAIATGNGPVDAAVSAIKTLINEKVVLMEFLMQAITRGSNDVGRVHVQVQCGSRTVHGFAAHTDTTRASIEAFLDALRVLNVTERKEKEE